jgi:long-chain acyl-CoA synthetase
MAVPNLAHRWLKSYPAGIDWAAPIAPKPLPRILDNAAAEFGSRPCVDFLDRQWTFAEIHSQANRLAKGLKGLDFHPGDRVGLFLPNCHYFVTA